MFSLGKKSSTDSGNDWVSEATQTIERVIDGVRDKAVVPLTTVARALVYGLLAMIVAVAAIVIFAIALVRILDIYLDYIPAISEGVWVADLVAGAIFVLAGLFLWSKRSTKAKQEG
jgi:hypothetical protein